MELTLRSLRLLAFAVLFSCLAYQTAAADSSDAEASRQLQALQQEYQNAQQEFSKVYQQAKTDQEREKAMEKYPQPAQYTGRFMAIAVKYPKAPAAADALVWIVQNDRYGSDLDKALEALLRDHLQSHKLSGVCESLVYSEPAKARPALEKILEHSPSREVRGQACLALGQVLKHRGSEAEAEKHLQRVVKEFGDIKSYRGTLADQAEAELFEVRNLAIGKVAPEIEGEDVDGNRFKLSDYRGKVVVIDFWGDW